MLKFKYSFYFIFLLLVGCGKDGLFKDDELSIERKDYSGNNLRIDGYYYQKVDTTFFSMYCFYRNGIVLYLGGGFNSVEIIELEESIRNGNFYNSAKTFKDFWGVYNIHGNIIKFEKWYPSSGGAKPAYIRQGEILNDTTFKISQSYRMKKGKQTEIREKDETYHFKKFSPKPDSTNSFIE